MINLVVPSKIVGGSEVESRTGGRASCTLPQGEWKKTDINVLKEKEKKSDKGVGGSELK